MNKRLFALAAAAVIVAAACSSGSGGSASAGATSGASAAASGGSDLTGKNWQLTALTTKVPAFQGVVPAADQAKYTIEFEADGTFAATADCNQVAGTYTATSSGGLTIKLGPSTMAACPEGSLGPEYVTALGLAKSYAIANAELMITLSDEGTLQYK
jgi:heat shock protein HslJ